MVYKNSFKWLAALCNLFILLSAADVMAQKRTEEVIDSLLKELPKARADSNKANVLDELSVKYWYVDPDNGLEYGQQELELAKKLGLQDDVARANSSIGGNYANKADYAKALKYEYDALKWYEATGNTRKEVTMLSNVAIVYRNKGDLPQALKYDSMALAKNDVHDTDGRARILGNIGNVYNSQKNYPKALEYFTKSMELNRLVGRKDHYAVNLGNIANVYADEGYSGQAMPYYFKAVRIYQELGSKEGVARNTGNIGETYLDISKDASGNVKPDSLVPAGSAANLQKAIDYLIIAVDECTKIGRLDYLVEYSSSLAEAYVLAGNYKGAFQSYKQFITTRDSIDDLAKHKEFTKRQMDYEYGKREDELRYQKKLNDERYLAGIAVLVIVSFFIYRNFRQQKKSNVIITKEKKRSDELLLNILPAEVAEELKDKGTAAAKHFDHVTVLFTDFVGFTKVSERLSAQELIDELHNCFKGFDEITTRYNIEKIKTIGDAYLAIAGVPVADPNHAEHVVRAAIEIRNFMIQRRAKLGDRTFEVRLGVNSGSVVAGIVGVKKFAYDIWGDTVNTAARMEQNSEAGKINISQTTYELVKDKFECVYRGEIHAKNKGELKMYFVAQLLSL